MDNCSGSFKCIWFSTPVSNSTGSINLHFLVQHCKCPAAYVITTQYLLCPSFNLPHLSPGFKANYLHEECNFLDSESHRKGLLRHFSSGSDSERSKSSTMCALQNFFWVRPFMNINHCVCCVSKSPPPSIHPSLLQRDVGSGLSSPPQGCEPLFVPPSEH